jgi:probable HAF family extracellular repeat protein
VKVAAAFALLAAAVAPTWAVSDLGAPPGHPDAFVQGVLVNASGTAVGIATEGVGTNRPQQQVVLYRNGRRTILAYRRSDFIDPVAIDMAGDVVGLAEGKPGDAILWRNGRPTALGALSPSALSADGSAVVGVGYRGRSPQGYVWRRGVLTELQGLGGSETYANAVSADGATVAGSSALASGVVHAMAWQGTRATDLGSVGKLDSTATLVGPRATIFGFASTHAGETRIAVEWKRGRRIILGRYSAGGAQPVGVNSRGHVLIQTQTAGGDAVGLRLLLPGRTVTVTVPPLGRQGLQAVGLDDGDDVVGYGTKTHRGFLWRDGRVILLPSDAQPRALAGGWIVASRSSGGGLLLRLRRRLG